MNKLSYLIDCPILERTKKPRHNGLTMVIDKGLSVEDLKSLLATASNYIDMIKFGFGTSLLYPEEILKAKVRLIRKKGISVFPGGTLFEIAYLQNKMEGYYLQLLAYGFSGVEISDGTIELPTSSRILEIKKAKAMGLEIITEIGKKDPRDMVNLSFLREQVKRDLEAGASKVIVEGRESGKGVLLYDQQGKLKEEDLDFFLKDELNTEEIIWEAPLKSQQQKLIKLFGSNVNLGNIKPSEIFALEALRRGLRGDTLRTLLTNKQEATQPSPQQPSKIESLIAF